MAIEIVDFPIKNGGSFHSYVSLPEGISSKWDQSSNAMSFDPTTGNSTSTPERHGIMVVHGPIVAQWAGG